MSRPAVLGRYFVPVYIVANADSRVSRHAELRYVVHAGSVVLDCLILVHQRQRPLRRIQPAEGSYADYRGADVRSQLNQSTTSTLHRFRSAGAGVFGVFIAKQLIPGLYAVLYLSGPRTGIVFVDNRGYSSGVTFLQVYFVTMLVIPIAYYFNRPRSARNSCAMLLFWGLVTINVLGMLPASDRNNILVSLLLPIVLSFSCARTNFIDTLSGLAVVGILAVVFTEQLGAFFDPIEGSNSVKLSLLEGYGRILSNPPSLIFGRGFGAYDEWERGYLYITEFTYLGLVRYFGLLGPTVMHGLLLYPVGHAFAANRSRGRKAIALGFAFYLLMCVSNPNLFSSIENLILSVMVGNIFFHTALKGNR